ncbi:MAG TPA: calcium-binding protein [Allosphingosinicella sp.]|nr:calcium-binding protein [Allosphingosinicella sp.]
MYDTAGDDVIDALGGGDEIHVSLGDDLVDGGTGLDILFVDYGFLTTPLVDSAAAGYDFAYDSSGGGARVGFRNVERLFVTAGSAADHFSTGAGDDRLDGGAGNDHLAGRAGNDVYVVDSSGDVIEENAGEGLDEVRTGLAIYSIAALANVENLAGTASEGQQLTGNVLDNQLAGNKGDDRLDGAGGGDTMRGGLGNDTYVVDRWAADPAKPRDNVIEGSAGGVDTVESSVTYGLAANVENLVLTGDAAIGGTGNSLANSLTGNGAANRLDGLAGADTMRGGAGNDIYVVDTWTVSTATADDVVVEELGEGVDTVVSSVTYVLPANVENLLLAGAAAINGTGNGLVNNLRGNGADNRLDGQAGADTMTGFAGNDTYVVDNSADHAVEAASGGTDVVLSSVTFTLPNEIENLVLTGLGAIDGAGNAAANGLTGNGAANRLDGKAGADTMRGGAGNDTYVVDSSSPSGATPGDIVIEAINSGTDTVVSSVSYALTANVENLILTGNAALAATGNALVNSLRGNGGNNRLDGQAGADTMTGGAGNDTYVVDTWTLAASSPDDIVVEGVNGGTDTVESSVTYVLPANVENLLLTGTAAINGTGNELANSLTGNSAANILDGKGGADTMAGGDGFDTYLIDNRLDKIVETATAGSYDRAKTSVSYTLGAGVLVEVLEAADRFATTALNLTGNELANRLNGNYGPNVLDGKEGADFMDGGDGDDIYYVDDPGDSVEEYSTTSKNDIVYASVSFQTAAWVEKIFLVGGALNGTASSLTTIVGNSADNRLDAGTMIGGLGNDTYLVKYSQQLVIEGANAGIDEVLATISYTLPDNVENLTAISGSSLTGNGIANVLTGNYGDNRLDGKGGADTMKGGLGNDVYIVDNVLDKVIEAAGAGSDMVLTSVSLTLAAGSQVESLGTIDGAGTAPLKLAGNEQANLIFGNAGANTLDGKGGADQMYGGGGNDLYLVDNALDLIAEYQDQGFDTVLASLNYTLSAGAQVEKLATADALGTAAIRLTGNAFANRIVGNAGANTLDGGEGADILSGGDGNDVYILDNAADVIVETATSGSLDIARASRSYTLGAGVRVETLTTTDASGTQDLSLTGNEFANSLVGNAGGNFLDGGGGADRMTGGAGDDGYVVDTYTSSSATPDDLVIEAANGGHDHVFAKVSYVLPDNVEDLILQGTADLSATGNSAANVLSGNSGANRLDGKAGADRMEGQAGDDTYIVDNALDEIYESASNGGADTVITSISYILPETPVETLMTSNAAGTAAINLTGNQYDNNLIGNEGANILDGSYGIDTMSGGGGNDTYILDQAADTIIETATTGSIDVAKTSVSYALAAGVRVETLETADPTSGVVIDLIGNEFDNRLIGNAGTNYLDGADGDDVLSGGDGADLLHGGAGNDTLEGGASNDGFFFATALDATTNVDRLLDFVTGVDVIGLYREVFAGIAADGTLAAGAFRIGTSAGDQSDRIIYDQATGSIYYDADGTGTAAQILFATVTPGSVLSNADFVAFI